MPFSFDLSDELKDAVRLLAKRDPAMADAINKKIRQIIASDDATIDHYKNLKHDLSEYKRVHIARNFVLLFKVSKKEKFILFDRFDHHDNIYKR
ncbi:MAG: addiction module toxin RelE [Candidatus Micrarchaeota archaeon]